MKERRITTGYRAKSFGWDSREDRKYDNVPVCVRDDFVVHSRNLVASASRPSRTQDYGISYSCGKVRLGIHGRKYEL